MEKRTVNEDLQELVRSPREDMNIELKRWMDLSDKNVQAKLAKELIALHNYGGGYLVLGFKDEHPAVPDVDNRPKDLSAFSTDAFNNIIKKFAEPSFHCMSHVVKHPETGEEYPVIVAPGGSKVPVRCKADAADGKSIRLDTYYTRRPGPESSPLQTAAEWDALLQRCLLSRKEELMSALYGLLGSDRAVLAGASALDPASPFDELRAFRDAAVARLEEMQREALPEDSAAKLSHGRYVLSARIVGDLKHVSPQEMLGLLHGLPRYTGWSPLNVFTRRELEPYMVGDDIIECWLARDPKEVRDAAHADFWRVSLNGNITLVRGHQEDAPREGMPAPGTAMEITLPAWRIAEFVLRVRHLGDKLTNGPFSLQLIVQWEGLAGRKLFSHGGRRAVFDEYVARDANYLREAEVTVDRIDAALPVILAELTTPLLRRFSFFEPPANFYEQELTKMLAR
ncbi:MAG: hypothetical protein C4535_14555 [Comamonadaceae bacterium]|nr:MAG: hypothetical protein C4535_14555 [Comamonadaceae bacterium]